MGLFIYLQILLHYLLVIVLGFANRIGVNKACECSYLT